MTYEKIKIMCIKKNVTMKGIAVELGISRQWLYKKLKAKDKVMIEKVKDVLKNV